jgi:multiple sugar transport system permease protein
MERRTLRSTATALLLLSPAIVIAGVFVYYPAISVVDLSLRSWDLISPTRPFVGTANYRALFASESPFWGSLVRTLQYGLIYGPLCFAAALAVALATEQQRRQRKLVRTLVFVPSVTSIAVIAVVWSLLYNPQIGPINGALRALGVPEARLPAWLNAPASAIPALAIMGAWQSLGLVTVLFSTGLAGIPRTYYDVAAVDGASAWTVTRHVTLPLLSPVLLFAVFILLVNAFRVFDAVAIMTKGRPLDSTNVLLYMIYRHGFQYFDAGFAAAGSVVVFVLVMAVALAQISLGERFVFYR